MRKISMLILCLFSLVMVHSAFALDQGKLSGYMFMDSYWVAANHNKEIKDKSGFWFRRIYFTYDNKLDEGWDVRFRVELSSPGDFKSKSKMTPVLKDGYLRYRKSGHQILFGLSPTPTWSHVVEKIWGYRSVEKTPMDLQKFGSSRDIGISFRGPLGAGKKVRYHFMVANGASNKAETNKGKKIMGSLGFDLTKNLLFEIYGDYEGRPGDTDRTTLQSFLAYHTKKCHIGLQYVHQVRKTGGARDLKLDLASVFATGKLSSKVSIFGRIDRMLDPNPDGAKISYIPFDPTAKSTFFIAGLDFAPNSSVHIMPNIEIVTYDDVAGTSVDTDIIPRVTFYYKF